MNYYDTSLFTITIQNCQNARDSTQTMEDSKTLIMVGLSVTDLASSILAWIESLSVIPFLTQMVCHPRAQNKHSHCLWSCSVSINGYMVIIIQCNELAKAPVTCKDAASFEICNHLLRCSTCRNRKPDYYIHCYLQLLTTQLLHLNSCLCHIFQKTIAEYRK
jgi:hypothetical protein